MDNTVTKSFTEGFVVRETVTTTSIYFQVSMTQGHATATGPTVTLVQLPNGQTVQVHGVIQAAQPSVIQSPQVQAVQVNVKHSPGARFNLKHNQSGR